jgi:hypothetical protein
VPDGWPRPGSTVQFVTDGIESAVARAKSAAVPKSGEYTGRPRESDSRHRCGCHASALQMVSMYRVDPEAADGAGDWVLVKQQDFGPQQ